jgi:hypothetical protein
MLITKHEHRDFCAKINDKMFICEIPFLPGSLVLYQKGLYNYVERSSVNLVSGMILSSTDSHISVLWAE